MRRQEFSLIMDVLDGKISCDLKWALYTVPMMSKPIIGVNLDFQENGGGFSAYPWHALRSNYFDVIRDAGGIPIGFPSSYDNPKEYVDQIDGLLATGGNDYNPALYGESVSSDHVKIMSRRSEFDVPLIQCVLQAQKPVLGICGGMQAINILYKGTLYQHLPDVIDGGIDHKTTDNPSKAVHGISILEHTRLHQIVNTDHMHVNSFHHQAIKHVGEGLIVNAVAPDGVIEGIEDPSMPFCMGVQWHPEYLVTDNDMKILKAFVEVCQGKT